MPAKTTKDFDSWGEYLDYSSPDNDKAPYHASRSGDYSFTKTHNFKEALELARSGWMDGADKAKVIAEPLFAQMSSLIEKPDITHDVEGMQIDIGRYLDNEPECWQRWEYRIAEEQGTRIVRLVYNGCISAGVGTDVIEAVGGAVAALVELLEYSGTRVEVWYALDYGNILEARVKIKSADQPLDAPRLAFSLGHPSSLRRIGFSFAEQLPKELREMGGGYSMPMNTDMKGDIYIPALHLMNEDLREPKTAQDWLFKNLKSCGVQLKERD